MPPRPDEPNIRDYLRPLWRWRLLIVGFVLAATVATYVYYDDQPKAYTASTQILVTAATNPLDPNASELSDRSLQNQAALLTSRDVATRVATRLGRPGDAAALAASIGTSATSGSDFVGITATRADPNDAAAVANAFAVAFIELRTNAARQRINEALSVLRGQLASLPRTTINAAQRAELQNTIRELQLTGQVSNGSASQVDPALPGAEISRNATRNAALAFIVAFIGAAGLAYALVAFDRKPRRLEELTPLYDLPVLSVLPHAPPVPGTSHTVPAPLKEPLRQLRTNIQLAALDQPFKTIVVTSAVAGEGKSTVVRNLAMVLREGGLRVVLVDADLRRPTLAKVLGQPTAPGLVGVLTGQSTLDDALVTVPIAARGLGALARMGAIPGVADDDSETDTITLLPSGVEPPDPQAVLAASRTRQLINDLAEEYDVVLIDTPPLLHVSDAVALAPWVDAVIVVSRLGHVKREDAARIPEVLRLAVGARPIGIVVNDVPAGENAGYGYGYES